MVFMGATVCLFTEAVAVSLFVWHSLYLYCGAILIGYVALMLLTVISKRKIISEIDSHQAEDELQYKSNYYRVVTAWFSVTIVLNLILLVSSCDLINVIGTIMFANIIIMVIAFVITMYWCERSDWRIWLKTALLG